jgi:hypothetical protein
MPTSYARAGRRGKSGFLTRLRRLPGRISLRAALALGVLALCVGGVANALFFQDAPHPAPMFGGKQQMTNTLPKQAPAEPPARPKPLSTAAAPAAAPPAAPAQPVAAAASPRPAAPVPPLPVPAPPQRPASDDIGSMIRSANFTPGATPAAPAATPVDSAQVLAVQKALVMRGFEIGKADGMMGPTTRQAIEKFERQAKLPVTGQVSPRLMRALGVQAASR